jgi:hypothetical protein
MDFKFDIYKVSFNEGRGGEAIPVKGASNNGVSNYFPAASPDGKWMVFCQAENYMLLMPGSKLYIVPIKIQLSFISAFLLPICYLFSMVL